MTVRQRLASAASAVLVALVLAGPAAALEAPDGVVLDGVVTVTFTRAAAEFGEPEGPIAGAEILLWASLNDFDPTLQELQATTDENGVATFEDVARADGDGPTVFLRILARQETSIAVGDCTQATSWMGEVDGVESAALVDVPLVGLPASSMVCPPPGDVAGVAFDGTVEVTFASELSGVPLAGASVNLRAFAGDEQIQSLDGTTGPEGALTFHGVARPESEAVDVRLVAEAMLDVSEDLGDCTFDTLWSGSQEAPGAEGTVAIPIAATATSTTDCQPGPDAPVLRGTVRTADGEPVVRVKQAYVSMTGFNGPAVAIPFQPAADGSFEVTIFAWGTPQEPATLTIDVIGEPTDQVADGDCLHVLAPVGRHETTVALAGGEDPEPVEIVAEVVEVGIVCGTDTGSGAPPAPGASGAPAITLPPTDAGGASGDGGSAPALGGILVTLGLVALAAAGTAVRRRRA